MVQMTEHAHDRRYPATGADEQQLLRHWVSEHEVALDVAERDDRPRPCLVYEVRRDHAGVDTLGGDADQPVLAVGVRRQRIGSPMAHPVYVYSYPYVLPRLVAGPPVTGFDQDRGSVTRLPFDLLNATPQLARRPQRVDQLEVVLRQQWRTQRAERLQHPLLNGVDVRACTLLRHLRIRSF